jgi:hypothetical protein
MKIMYLLATTLLLSACVRFSDLDRETIKGSGKIATETRSLSGFSKISLEGDMEVYVSQGAGESVRIEADDNLLRYVTTKIEGNELVLSTSESLNSENPIKLYVTADDLTALSMAGSGKMITQTPFTAKDFSTSIAGSGDIDANIVAQKVSASIAGSGNVILKGSADLASVSVAGSGDVKGYNLIAKTASVDIAGSGNCELSASEQLTGNIMGSGSIYYHGDPKLNKSIMGSGDIKKK